MNDYTSHTKQGRNGCSKRPIHSFRKMAHNLGAMSESDRIKSIKTGFTIEMADVTK